MKNTALLVALSIIMTGCAVGGWTRPNTTEAEFRRDTYQCEQEAARMYPAAMVQVRSPYQQDTEQTNCTRYGNRLDCTTTKSDVQPSVEDANAGARNNAHRSCLNAKGYVWKLKQ